MQYEYVPILSHIVWNIVTAVADNSLQENKQVADDCKPYYDGLASRKPTSSSSDNTGFL